jgi:hypothetical protein
MKKWNFYRIGLLASAIMLKECMLFVPTAAAMDSWEGFLSVFGWGGDRTRTLRTPWPTGTPQEIAQNYEVGKDNPNRRRGPGLVYLPQEVLDMGAETEYRDALRGAKENLVRDSKALRSARRNYKTEDVNRYSSSVLRNLRQVVALASVEHSPAVLSLSVFFRDGMYGLPKSKRFSVYLLSSLDLHREDMSEAIADLDGATVCYVVQECHRRYPRVFTRTRLLTDLAPEEHESVIARCLLYAEPFDFVTRNFKKPDIWPLYMRAAFGETLAVAVIPAATTTAGGGGDAAEDRSGIARIVDCALANDDDTDNAGAGGCAAAAADRAAAGGGGAASGLARRKPIVAEGDG